MKPKLNNAPALRHRPNGYEQNIDKDGIKMVVRPEHAEMTVRLHALEGTEPVEGHAAKPRGLWASAILTLLIQLVAVNPAYAVQDSQTYRYDPVGNLTQQINPLTTGTNPVVTNTVYDELDRNIYVSEPPPSPGQPRLDTAYVRDGQGQIEQVWDPKSLHTDYSVDGLGNVTALGSPDTGNTASTYYDNGLLKTQTDARGKTTSYRYDALNRVICIEYAAPTANCTAPGRTQYTYDGGAGNTVAANVGKLTRIDDESGLSLYFYDALGRLTRKNQKLAGSQTAWYKDVTYAYGTTGTAKGKLASLTYPSGNKINYAYNAAGQIASVSLNPTNANGLGANTAVTTNLLTGIHYFPTGGFNYGFFGNYTAANDNGLTRNEDLDGRAVSYRLGNLGQGGFTRTLAIDPGSRITAMTHAGTGIGTFSPANFNQTFAYDNLGRITAYSGAAGNQTYGYDDNGSRISTGATSQTVDAFSNRLLKIAPTAVNRSYDLAGNLTGDGTYTYTYSDRGRLQSVKNNAAVTSYAYNGLGQRVKKITGSTDTTVIQYLYDEQGHLLGEYDFYGRPLQETVYLGDMPIAVLNQTYTTGTGIQADNTDTAKVAVVGTWPAATTPVGYIGTNYQSHAATATTTDSFTWKLALPTTGKYYYQARLTGDTITRANNAPYTVTGTDGVTVKTINQTTPTSTWVNLGLKTNTVVGNVATIKLGTSATGPVFADMVQALPVTVTTTVNYVFADHINTPRVIIRSTDNQMLWRWDAADPFGAAQPNTNPAGLGVFTYNPRFPGQVYDSETGLYYNYHRHYSPNTGTYTQSDPIGLGGGVNTYSYVSGNPVNLTDPLGLKGGCPANMKPGPNNTCVADPGNDNRKECGTAECATKPPASTNCSCTISCFNNIVRGGGYGSITLGAICGKIIGIPGTGSACTAAIWAACGTACEKECSGPCTN